MWPVYLYYFREKHTTFEKTIVKDRLSHLSISPQSRDDYAHMRVDNAQCTSSSPKGGIIVYRTRI